MTPTLPLELHSRANTRTARVFRLGVGLKPMTCEVVMELDNSQYTIWYAGHRLGDVVQLERRVGSSGPYWCEIGVTGTR